MSLAGAEARLTPFLTRIQEVCPHLHLHDVSLFTDGGQFHDLLFTSTNEGDLVFRFPRFQDGAARLPAVAHLLRALQNRVPLPVPNPHYVSPDPPLPGQSFIAYERIPGESLQRETVSTLDPTTLHFLTTRAVHFLRALHTIPLDVAFPAAPSPYDLLAEWQDLYARIHHHLFPRMSPSGRDRVVRHFEDFFSDVRIATIKPTVAHGDFGTGNLLVDASTHRLTGVLDFDHAVPADPALDYATLLSDFPIDLVRSLAPEVDDLMWRTDFYRGTYLLQEALYGAEHDNPESLHAGLSPFT
jgi:aminoglycoside 2''-phosphotransferase